MDDFSIEGTVSALSDEPLLYQVMNAKAMSPNFQRW
jgi:hypothetical protein